MDSISEITSMVATVEQPLSISQIQKQMKELAVAEDLAIKRAFESNNVQDIMKAQSVIEQRQKVESKSLLLDPFQLATSLGYKDKPYSISYNVLRAMAKTHIIKSIVETRKEQVGSFCTPQTNKYATGFVIQKRSRYTVNKEEKKLTKKEEQRIEDITEFLLNCGNVNNFWHADTFDTFIGKLVTDSLILDQATAEVVRDRGGSLIEFFATDGGTYRVSNSYENGELIDKRDSEIKGYTPSHVQIYQNRIHAEFYPWELLFGVRNPQTELINNGYGRSELEDMIQTVTAILNSDFYNANFFKVGSSPKGILKYSGNINQNTVEDFRRQWVAQVSGVANMHKIPLINADKLDFINTMVNNKDMEFSKYQEFLIKISCAMYKMDPSEIGFPMSGSMNAQPMFEGNNEARLKYSKDKGLKPLLKKIEFWVNKWVVWQLDKDFEFRFVGIDDESNQKDDLEQDIQRLSNFQTVNEIRAKWNLPPVEGGDVILNPTFVQSKMQDQNMMYQGGDGGGFYDDEEREGDEDTEGVDKGGVDNPFIKSLEQELPKIFS